MPIALAELKLADAGVLDDRLHAWLRNRYSSQVSSSHSSVILPDGRRLVVAVGKRLHARLDGPLAQFG